MKWLLSRRTLRVGFWAAVGALYLLPLMVVSGAVDYFLKIEGVDGESTDQKHKDWIQLESVQMGVSRSITGSGANRSIGPSKFDDITVTKWIDKSSPILMLNCAQGKVFPKMEISRRVAGGGAADERYLDVSLYDALLSSAKPAGSASVTEELPKESLSLNFTKIEMRYSVIDVATGGTNYETNVTCVVEPSGLP
jgi:type VI secretion system secreted protein Hcp